MIALYVVATFVVYGVIREVCRYTSEKKAEELLYNAKVKVTLTAIDKLREELDNREKREEDNFMSKVQNKKSLTEILKVEATEEDYKEYMKILVDWIKDLYTNYNFQLLKPEPGDKKSGFAVSFELFHAEKPKEFEKLFKLAIDRGLSDEGINKEFMKAVKAGDIADLGDAIIAVEGTGSTSILRGENLNVFISYETPEYKEERIEQEDKDEAFQKEHSDKQKAYQDKQREIHQVLVEASAILREMNEKQLEDNPEFVEQINKVKELF